MHCLPHLPQGQQRGGEGGEGGYPPPARPPGAAPPAPALPASAAALTLSAALTLAPGAVLHEYLFQRLLGVAVWGAGGGVGAPPGSYPPLALPPALPPPALAAAVAWAQAVTLFSLVLWLAGMSLHFLGRAATPWHRPRVLATRVWACAVALVVALQVAHSCATAAGSGAGSNPFSPAGAPWDVWVTVLLWQLCAHALLTVAKAADVGGHTQTMKRLRLAFDTRLGQWSPR